ncbi:MAG TPA: PAS domain S-box protein, partial [bacterium]|nr:PAS domain S-box protein [bacterium]
MAEAVENHHKSKTENDRIISEIQLKLLRTDNLEDLFGILSASVHELIGTGVVASVQLNEADSSMQFVNCIGLGDTLDKIISALGFDPTKKLTPIDKMKEREFRIYCSGKLEKIDAGLYGLLESLVPENVCSNVQKMMNVKDVFTIGLIQKDLPMGGLVILTRNDISEHFDAIERIVGQAAFVIQRKRAEEALKKSEEKYRLLINTANESVIVTQNGFFRFANPMTLTLLDVESEKELIDEPFAKFLYPEDSGILSDFRSRISQKSQTHKFSIRIMTKKKESKWVEINSVLFEWQSRKATLSFITDVTEKKQIVDALRESELKYRTLIDCANEIIAVIQDGTACHVNSMAVSLTGYSEAELTSNPFETFIYPEDRHMIMERHQKRLKCESVPDRYEFRLVMKDGSIRWVQNGAVQIEWNGRPATLNFLVDINDRKKAEKEVLKIVQHYQALIEKAPDGVVLINAAGLFKFISPSAKKIFGYGVFEEIIGNPAEFTHPDDLPVVLSELAKIFENPSYVPILQYRFAHKSGNWIWIESTFSNLLADPSVESVVINFRDITDRKKIEEIIQRTAKLDSLGVLAGGIAHDFNNILAGIFGYIDLANSRSKDLKVSEYLSKALNSMERARGLTEQLLTFSKGGDPVKKTALLFPYLQETALFALSGSAVSCNFDYPENLWTCNFDCNQIGQVIENVVINAQQSM